MRWRSLEYDCAHWCAAVFGPTHQPQANVPVMLLINRSLLSMWRCRSCFQSVVSGIAMGSASAAPSLPSASAIPLSAKPATQLHWHPCWLSPGQTCENGQCSGCESPGVCGTSRHNCQENGTLFLWCYHRGREAHMSLLTIFARICSPATPLCRLPGR